MSDQVEESNISEILQVEQEIETISHSLESQQDINMKEDNGELGEHAQKSIDLVSQSINNHNPTEDDAELIQEITTINDIKGIIQIDETLLIQAIPDKQADPQNQGGFMQVGDYFDNGKLIQEEQQQTITNQLLNQVEEIQQEVCQGGDIQENIQNNKDPIDDDFDDGELIQEDPLEIIEKQIKQGAAREIQLDIHQGGEIQKNIQTLGVDQEDELDEGELIQENIQPENSKLNEHFHEGELIQNDIHNQTPQDEDFDEGELIHDTDQQSAFQNNQQLQNQDDDFDDGELIQDRESPKVNNDDDDFDDGELIQEQPKVQKPIPIPDDDEFEEGEIIEDKQNQKQDDEFEEGEIMEPIQECSYPLSTQSLQSLTHLFNKFNKLYNAQQDEYNDRQIYEIKPATIPPIIKQLEPTAEQYREQIKNHFQVWFHCSSVQAALSEYGITLEPVNFEFTETQTCDSPFSQRSISDISPLKSQQKSQSELPSVTNQQKFFRTDSNVENILDLIPDYSHLLSTTIMIK